MANAIGDAVSMDSLLNSQAGKNIFIVSSVVRKYPLLAYIGFNISNHFKRSVLDSTISYEDAGTINFKEIGGVKPVMSEDGSKVTWHESSMFANSQPTTANTATTTVLMASTKGFAVGDIVITVPASGSAGTRVQAKITTVNTNVSLVLDTAVSMIAGDKVMFLYPSFQFNTKVTRTVADDTSKPVTTYFQKFGGSLSYTIQEINKVYIFTDAVTQIKNKFSMVTNQAINNFAYTWYTGRNISGANAETDGLERVIAEKAAAGESVVKAIAGADDKAKIAYIQDMLTQASSAPVYMGNEQPLAIVNENMIGFLAGLLQSSVVYNDFVTKDIDWGLKAFSSPFFKGITFIVDQTLNQLYPSTKVGFLVPKHLMSFMCPTYDTPDSAGVSKTYTSNGFKLIKQPVTTGDSVEFTLEMWMANIFAGQSFPNSYMKFTA